MPEKKRFLLRISGELCEVLEKWAADDLRSVNAQIEYLLNESARTAHRWRAPAPGSRGVASEDDPPNTPG